MFYTAYGLLLEKGKEDKSFKFVLFSIVWLVNRSEKERMREENNLKFSLEAHQNWFSK